MFQIMVALLESALAAFALLLRLLHQPVLVVDRLAYFKVCGTVWKHRYCSVLYA